MDDAAFRLISKVYELMAKPGITREEAVYIKGLLEAIIELYRPLDEPESIEQAVERKAKGILNKFGIK